MFLTFLMQVLCIDFRSREFKNELKNIQMNKNSVFYYDLPTGIDLDNIQFTHDDNSFRIKYGKNLTNNENGRFESIQGEYSKKVSYKLTNGKISIEKGKIKVSFGDKDIKTGSFTNNLVPRL